MTIYVDALVRNGWKLRGHTVMNCHLFSDVGVDELHAFAERIGMRRAWFQDQRIPHYDLTAARRRLAIACGAVEVNRRQDVEILAPDRGAEDMNEFTLRYRPAPDAEEKEFKE